MATILTPLSSSQIDTTFLALVNRVRRECGITGTALVTLQGSLSDESQRIKDWVADAWNDIQIRREDWRFMRKSASFQTNGVSYVYTPSNIGLTSFANWIPRTFRAYVTSSGVGTEMFLDYIDYDRFRNSLLFNNIANATSRPLVITVQPDDSLAIWPTPVADTYTIRGDYYGAPNLLFLDSDDPCAAGNGLPQRFYMLIIYLTMAAYAAYEAAPEVDERARVGAMPLWRKLDRWAIPGITLGGALA